MNKLSLFFLVFLAGFVHGQDRIDLLFMRFEDLMEKQDVFLDKMTGKLSLISCGDKEKESHEESQFNLFYFIHSFHL